MRNVSKDIFLRAVTCPTLGWLTRTEGITKTPTLADRFRMEQGRQVEERARELWPNGLLVDEADWIAGVEKTRSVIEDPAVPTIFGGSFEVDGYATKADILKRTSGGWHVIEVKSSTNDKPEFIDDMAYTAMVAKRSGIEVAGASVLLLSKDFRLGMHSGELFVEIDHTAEVLERVREFELLWKELDEITRGKDCPEAELRFACKGCKIFRECTGGDVANHVFEIPRISQSKFDQLTGLGIVSIEKIPEDFSLTEKQQLVRNCVQSKRPFVSDRLSEELQSISWPTYYLDFETFSTAIPLYEDVAPFAKLPTQHSIHKCSRPGKITGHSEYLADPAKDCRRELAENLIKNLGKEGSIMVYHASFEKSVINGLGLEYSDLSDDLEALADRIIDLEAMIIRSYYHPNFHGSYSIKTTLPVLVPDMSYDGMPIPDGDSASAAFALCALGRLTEKQIESVRKDLLLYCKQDTLAMVRLHERLTRLL